MDRGFTILEFHKIIERLIAKAATEMGKELAASLLPTYHFEEAVYRQQETYEGFNLIRLKGGIPFHGVHDIRGSIKRARIGGMLSAEQLRQISTTLMAGRKIKKLILQLNEEFPLPILQSHAELIGNFMEIEGKINESINEYNEIMDSASHELKTIRQQIRTIETRVKEKLEFILRNPAYQKMLQDPIITIRNQRYVIPVKQEYRAVFGGIVHDQSASGATLFIEPESVVQMNNRLRESQLKEEKEIEKILKQLTELIRLDANHLEEMMEHLGVLDFIQAKADLAREMKATQPKLNQQGFINLKKARHPLIKMDEVVPIDVHLGKEFHSLIITGPNTGGKTVTLKTIGLLTLMSMSGLYIPAEEDSEVAVFSSIFADIGDEQSIEQSLSTFSSHLKNIIQILKKMDSNSLVLLDELGAGTDPTEGAALAIAILEKIRSLHAKVVATTHYSELKAYAYNNPGVINASVEFDVETLRPTYRLLIGVPGRSNAFAIAKRLGLPEDMIQFAKNQVSEEDLHVESMIHSLEWNQRKAEKEREEAERLRKQTEEMKKEVEEKLDSLEATRYRILEEAKKEAVQIIRKATQEADGIIRELRKLAQERRADVKEHEFIEMKRRLNESAPELEKPQLVSKKRNQKIKVGDEVKVSSLGQKGLIVEQVSKDEYIVQIGIIKTKVNKQDLELVEEQKNSTPKMMMTGVKRTKDFVKPELDLRGKTVDEALIDIDRYLADALMAGYKQVSIIHGKGTGALRIGVQDFLKRHKLTKSIRMGQYGEGGNGVTVVELKA
ncbi:endonuclease MutS2 [Tepidibacillus fermentans]|uniref:Endonuclease MutS2 n=1 Tax=Tepidibacillus fermentans TaxID=1281767 RepID=A0A4R3KIY4_9BACI|nr:endonuclease MutS2 [Tepidibacillus fermentans]TCS83506.1 DNA mismatch repair protein MutS2 [Tepidibacillus fermentans]